MAWDEVDIERLFPEEKAYSIVRVDTMKPPFSESAAVKEYEVDDLDEAALPDESEVIWMAYDTDGNSQVLKANVE